MAYIGNTASTRYVANRAASVYSGDGSTYQFTLEEAVGSDEDILVSVDGVIQEPSVAYTVSSGTTLDFGETTPPSSNAGNNIFVYYLSLAKGSIVHPSNVGLTATTGVFSSNATVGGTLGVTGVPTFTGRSVHSGGITIANAGQIGSVGDADAMAISSSGVVTFSQTPVGAGGLQLLSTQTASNSTGIIFDSSLITDTYNNYFIIGHNMSPATDTASPELYMSIDDGANYNLSVGTGRAYLRLQGAGSGHEHENTTDSSIQMGNSQSNLAAEAQSFFGYLQNLRSAAEHKHAHGTYSGAHSSANDAYSWRFGARVIATSKINNVKFDFHSGNFDGVISLYGIRG